MHDHTPCARWQTSTFLAALRVTGFTAPGVFDGAIDGKPRRAQGGGRPWRDRARELCFAKLKAIVRVARCRSIETLWPLLGESLKHFSADECRNYFRHCGYATATRS
jgi:hypothetical protein